jgi:hypothetical protein
VDDQRRGREKQRKVRLSDQEWSDAKWAVQWRGAPSVSSIIRDALHEYVGETKAMERLQEARRRAREQRSEPRDGINKGDPTS